MDNIKFLTILVLVNFFAILHIGLKADSKYILKASKEVELNNEERFKQTAEVARYMIHNIHWATTVTLQSTKKMCITKTTPKTIFGNIKSITDGYKNKSTGIPYFYLQKGENILKNIRKDNRTSLTVTVDQLGYCQKLGIDTVEPQCSRIILMGRTEKLNKKSAEFDLARIALKATHPHFKALSNTKYVIAKLNIENVVVVDGPGGLRNLPLDYYYSAKPIWKDNVL